MPEAAVLYEKQGPIGLVTLNRPEQRNSMTPELLDAFSDVANKISKDSSLRCVVITGKGKCFSAGADLKAGLQRSGLDLPPEEASYAMYIPFLKVLDIEVPVIAALNGHTVGGGLGLAMLADIRIANRDAKYGANFTRLGINAGLAITYNLPRLVGVSHASELLYTGTLISGARAAEIGLASRALPAEEVLPEALRVAQEIAKSAPLAVRSTKKSMREGLAWKIREAARAEAPLQAASIKTEDAKEGMAALLEKRDPSFVGR